MSWCPRCSPCCPTFSSKKKRSDKYGYIRYTPSKQPPPELSHVPDINVPTPEQLFEFPQEKADVSQHPQMFVEGGDSLPPAFGGGPVMDQPMARSHPHVKRFSSLPAGTTTVGGPLSNYASRKSSTLPRAAKKGKKDGSLSDSLPDLHGGMAPMLMHGSGSKKPSPLKRRRSEPVSPGGMCRQEMGWVPGLPVLEETTLGEETSHPLLQFSLMYDVQRCTLTVHLHHGSNLPAKDRRGTSDPFVVLYLVPNKEEIFESKVIPQTLDPIFDQSFEFKKLTPDDIFRQTLILRIYDHDKFSKNDSIGGVILPLQNTELFGVVMRMKIDEDPNLFSLDTRGDLLLALSYDMSLSSIKGVVLKATNLKRQDVMGLADPYIKIRLLHKKKVIDKWKSSVKRNTLIPVFNESFQFDILGKDVGNITMEVLVMDYDRFSKDDVVGIIELGKNSEGDLERRHWMDMLNGTQVISQWHTIRPV